MTRHLSKADILDIINGTDIIRAELTVRDTFKWDCWSSSVIFGNNFECVLESRHNHNQTVCCRIKFCRRILHGNPTIMVVTKVNRYMMVFNLPTILEESLVSSALSALMTNKRNILGLLLSARGIKTLSLHKLDDNVCTWQ